MVEVLISDLGVIRWSRAGQMVESLEIWFTDLEWGDETDVCCSWEFYVLGRVAIREVGGAYHTSKFILPFTMII